MCLFLDKQAGSFPTHRPQEPQGAHHQSALVGGDTPAMLTPAGVRNLVVGQVASVCETLAHGVALRAATQVTPPMPVFDAGQDCRRWSRPRGMGSSGKSATIPGS